MPDTNPFGDSPVSQGSANPFGDAPVTAPAQPTQAPSPQPAQEGGGNFLDSAISQTPVAAAKHYLMDVPRQEGAAARQDGQVFHHILNTLLALPNDIGANTLEQLRSAYHSAKAGQPIEALNHAVGAVPVVGPTAYTFGRQIDAKNYSGAAGTAVGAGLTAALPGAAEKVATKLSPELTTESFGNAIGASPVHDRKVINKAIPHLKEAGVRTPTSLQDASSQVKGLLNKLDEERQASMPEGYHDVTVPKQTVVKHLEEAKEEYLNPAGNARTANKKVVQALDEHIREINEDYPDNIKVGDLEDSRNSTNRPSKWAGNGDADSAEANRAAGDAYRNAIATQFPQLRDLNTRQIDLGNLNKIIDKKLNNGGDSAAKEVWKKRDAASKVASVAGAAAGAKAGSLIGHPVAGAGVGAKIGDAVAAVPLRKLGRAVQDNGETVKATAAASLAGSNKKKQPQK